MDSFCVIDGGPTSQQPTPTRTGTRASNQIAIPATPRWISAAARQNLRGAGAAEYLRWSEDWLGELHRRRHARSMRFGSSTTPEGVRRWRLHEQRGLGTPGVQGTFSFYSAVLATFRLQGALACCSVLAGLPVARRRSRSVIGGSDQDLTGQPAAADLPKRSSCPGRFAVVWDRRGVCRAPYCCAGAERQRHRFRRSSSAEQSRYPPGSDAYVPCNGTGRPAEQGQPAVSIGHDESHVLDEARRRCSRP